MRTINSEHGYSMLEVLISSALGTIVLAGAFDVYVSSTKSMKGQTNSVQMLGDTKAAMDYMIRELRMAQTAYSAPTITHDASEALTPPGQPIVHKDTIAFTRTEDAGYSSGGNTATTLWDTNKSGTWKTNQFAPAAATGSYSVWIKSGTGQGQVQTIQSNTTTALTVTPGWTLPYPDNTSLYFIIRTKTFTLGTTDNTVRYQVNTGTNQLLAQNVTALSFALANPCNSTTVCVNVTLTAQSKDPDPLTGQYRAYSMTDTARPRNH